MKVELSKRAVVILEHLPAEDKKRVNRIIKLLETFPNGDGLRGKYHKVLNVPGKFYIVKAGLNLRLIFQVQRDALNVLDIVDHDRMERMFNLEAGGGK
jgi:mRNA-degrading endonuclease RelE of RelBE toxin-antitoxin system